MNRVPSKRRAMSEAHPIGPSVICLRAPNPSLMTLDGTNGYVVHAGGAALVAIDPGVDDSAHIESFVRIARTSRARYVAILVTHGHRDHYPGAHALGRLTGAPVYAHRSATFGYDRPLDDGARLLFGDAEIDALHTPGHAADHLVFWLAARRALFTGDLIVGSGSVLIAPPSGDMRAYQLSLARLLRDYADAEVIYGGHGPPVHTPRAKISEYIEHRKAREAQIVAALDRASATIPALVEALYAGLAPSLQTAAAAQIAAHLIALEREGRVVERTARTASPSEARLLDPLSGFDSGQRVLQEYALRRTPA